MFVGAGAVVSPALALTGIVGLVFVAIAFQSLPAGLALFTVLIFFERIPGVPSSGLSGVKAGGAVLAAAWLAVVLNRRTKAPLLLREHPLVAYAALAFAGWALASQLWAEDVGAARSNALRLVQGVVLFLIVFTAIQERRHLRWIVWAFLSAAFVTAIIGLAGATSAEDLGPYASERAAGQIGDPNELAAMLVPALAFAAFMLAVVRAPLVGWLLVTLLAVFSLTLFQTQSRGGLIALGVTILVAPLVAGPMRGRALGVALGFAAAAVCYFALLAPAEARERVTTFSEGGGTGRPDLWHVATRIVSDHPVVGVGAGNFIVFGPLYVAGDLDLPRVDLLLDVPKVVHNTYLDVLTELGAVGLAAFLGLVLGALGLALRAARAFARAGERELELLARGVLVGTIGMLAAFTFITAQYEKQLWLLLGVCAALSSLARRAGVTR